ncbi:MAG: TRAP transporter large permease subunit [Bradymonadales bacterium]|jgi:TRAP-type C4-dicarboxylate transport system permease large subunit
MLKKLSHLFTTLPLLILIISIIAFSTMEKMHSQVLSLGESNWEGYSELRLVPEKPVCETEAAPKAVDEATKGEETDLLGGDDDEFDLDALFGEEEEEASEEAAAAAAALCAQKIANYERVMKARESASLRKFVAIESGIGKIARESTNWGREFLVFVFLFAALATTLRRQHLALRSPQKRLSDRISQGVQLGSNLLVVLSFYLYYQQDLASGVAHVSQLPIYWMAAFGLMALANIALLLRPLKNKEKSSPLDIALGIPLYTFMGYISAFYFFAVEGHGSGLAIYMSQITEHASLYINVALYVFSGMMLKNTNIADKFFALIRPWKLSPELFIFIIVIASAIPTAYSGASGIFVIAAGAIIYREFRRAHIRPALAQAATALSGSMGIVLSPCLLIVIIAALNKDVTTSELFGAGINVFILNIVILAAVLFAMRNARISAESPKIALPAMGRASVELLPYIAIATLTLLFFKYIVGASFDEYSAPVLLPFILVVLLIYDRIVARRAFKRERATADEDAKPSEVFGIARALHESASSTGIHAGALLSLMTLSICIGGIIDRANLNALLPQHFSSPFLAMALLFVILVIIGMIMDPYGAVILVSASLTQIAYANGISPLHFWLTVLCAFELGYLTPPVALNQLLIRQIIGEQEFGPSDPKHSFWRRNERFLFPVVVKALVLLLVAFVPLFLKA